MYICWSLFIECECLLLHVWLGKKLRLLSIQWRALLTLRATDLCFCLTTKLDLVMNIGEEMPTPFSVTKEH